MNNATAHTFKTLLAPACALALALLAPAPAARADSNPPDRLTFQGYLTDATGTALGNSAPKNYDMVFRIYDALSGGNRVWSEFQTVTVDKGNYSVLLGEGTGVSGETHPALATLFASATASDRYVEITVKGVSGSADTTIAPRLRLLTSPYAYLATGARSVVSTTNVVLIATNNCVGIGTSAPLGPLDVIGQTYVDRLNIGRDTSCTQASWQAYLGGGPEVRLGICCTNTGDNFQVVVDTNGVRFGGYNLTANNPGPRDVLLQRNGGNVGIGPAPRATARLDSSCNPGQWISVAGKNPGYPAGDSPVMGTFYNYAVIAAHSAALDGWRNLYVGYGPNSDGSLVSGATVVVPNLHVGGYTGSLPLGHVLMCGNGYCDQGAWCVASDRRLKHDIQPSLYGLAEVLKMQPVTFLYNNDTNNVRQIGFIAQEVKQIIPELVDGKEGDLSKGETLGMGYGNISAVLVNAVKEQQKQIAALSATVAELKAAVAALQAKAAK